MHKTAIGFAEATDLCAAFPAMFVGQSVDNTSLLQRYTAAGDANLDRVVDTLDFNSLAANFGNSGQRWPKADFDYDATIDTLDFNPLASNFGQLVPTTSSSPNVAAPAVRAAMLPLVPTMLLPSQRLITSIFGETPIVF